MHSFERYELDLVTKFIATLAYLASMVFILLLWLRAYDVWWATRHDMAQGTWVVAGIFMALIAYAAARFVTWAFKPLLTARRCRHA